MSFLKPEIMEIINAIQTLPSLSLTIGCMKIEGFDKDEEKLNKIQEVSDWVEKRANDNQSSLPEPAKSLLQEFIAFKSDLFYSTDSDKETASIATYFALDTLKRNLSEVSVLRVFIKLCQH